jgi:hypothetical protein
LPHDLLAKSTVHDHFSQWKGDGTWQKILDALVCSPKVGPAEMGVPG